MAPFIDNVSDYVSSRDEVEPTLRSFQEMISKYQFMEVNTQRRGQGLREKIPDIKKTLEMVRFLKLRKEVRRHIRQGDRPEYSHGSTKLCFFFLLLLQANPDTDLETNFELNDTLYARASVSPAEMEEVYLWLGANVMLAYPLDEAEKMLSEKLTAAESSLAHCEEDLEFLREQITVRTGCLCLEIALLWVSGANILLDFGGCDGAGV